MSIRFIINDQSVGLYWHESLTATGLKPQIEVVDERLYLIRDRLRVINNNYSISNEKFVWCAFAFFYFLMETVMKVITIS